MENTGAAPQALGPLRLLLTANVCLSVRSLLTLNGRVTEAPVCLLSTR
jgi:hypothetical protein